MDVSEENFRKVLGLFPTGVTIVTVSHDGVDRGLTISSFTSLSLDPPQVLFCLSNKSKTMAFFKAAPFFAVNILKEDQADLSHSFAQHTPMPWDLIPTRRHGTTGCLLMSDALGHVICQKETLYEGGDHTIIIGKVVDLQGPQDAHPLIRWRGQYLTTQPRS